MPFDCSSSCKLLFYYFFQRKEQLQNQASFSTIMDQGLYVLFEPRVELLPGVQTKEVEHTEHLQITCCQKGKITIFTFGPLRSAEIF